MSRFALFGLVWLAVSIVLAPMVGRMIHDPHRCPQCRAKAAAQAAHRQPKASAAAAVMVGPVRCWCCPGAPLVDDYRTHSRLVHHPSRPLGAEDSSGWPTC